MKNHLFLPLLLLGLSGRVCAAEFVHETPVLFTASADVDADGDADAVIVDRVTGLVTVGVRQSGGGLLFRQPAPSGIPDVTGVAVGRLLVTTRDTLALTSPAANRVQVLSADKPSLQPYFTAHPIAGPRHIAAFGAAGLEKLPLAAGFSGVLPLSLRLMTNQGGGAFATVGAGSVNAAISDWNPVRMSRSGDRYLASLEQSTGSATLRLYSLFGDSFADPVVVPGLPAHSRLSHGQFDVPQTDFIFYVPGTDVLEVLRVEPGAEKTFLPRESFNAGKPLSQLICLKDAAADQVLMIFTDDSAVVYDYTLADGFQPATTLDLSAEPGGAQTAVALADGSFALLTGTGTDGRPLAHRLYTRDGSGAHVPHSGGSLPALGRGPAPWGNVFFFNGTPFLQDDTRLVGQWSVGDWSSAMIFGVNPSADGESFVSSQQGLGSRFTRHFSPVPAGALGALANQYRDDISLARLDSTPRVLGERSAGVVISPAGGEFQNSTLVSLSAADPAASLYYRTSGTASFDAYVSPVRLFQDTTLEAYAQLPGGARTPVSSASFTFTLPPEKQDSDSDGVPDFVEKAHGLDPDGGADSDEDGFSDLEELIAGTLPNDAEDFPAEKDRLATAAQLRLSIQPQPWDGSTNSAAFAKEGLPVECHEVDGTLLGAGTTSKPLGTPFAAFACQPVEAQQRLLVVGTPLHFQLRTDVNDQRRGRELVGLIPVPDAVPVNVAFTYGSGSPAAEAQSWIEAATTAYTAAEPATIIRTIGVDETLVFLLTEARLMDLLQFRGLGSSGGFSLTPYRDNEARDPFMPGTITSAQLLSLERAKGSPQHSTSVNLRALLAHYETLVANATNDPAMALLKQLAREMYRVSSTQLDEAPGELKPPLDALRQFLRFIFLDSEYSLRVNLTPEQIQQVSQNIYPWRFNAPVRSHVTLTLKIPQTAPADGRTYARSQSGALLYSLWDQRGQPFELPGHFRVTPGSEFHITAYNDLPPVSGSLPLEVFSLTLTTVPLPSVTDADGNLLPDEWERLFFGSTGQDAFSSPNGSGYTLLQQFLEGSDPTQHSSVPSGPPAVFVFEDVAPQRDETGSYSIYFHWPTAYLQAFEFIVRESTDLTTFTPRSATITHLGGGHHRAVIPASSLTRAFYQVGVRLR